jgi:hypothetical protein
MNSTLSFNPDLVASFSLPLDCDDVIHHVLVFLPNKKKMPIPLTNIRSVRDIRRVLNDYSLHPESEAGWVRKSLEQIPDCPHWPTHINEDELKENRSLLHTPMKEFPAVDRFFMFKLNGKMAYTGWHLGMPRQEDVNGYFPAVLGTLSNHLFAA